MSLSNDILTYRGRRMMPTLQAQAIALKAKLYRGFADPSRLSILESLQEGPLPVNAIVEKTGLSRTNVSNHLRCLSDCDLVTSGSQGRYTFYQLSHPKLRTCFASQKTLFATLHAAYMNAPTTLKSILPLKRKE